jgi:hypothetical protein
LANDLTDEADDVIHAKEGWRLFSNLETLVQKANMPLKQLSHSGALKGIRTW